MEVFRTGTDENGEFYIDPMTGEKIRPGAQWATREKFLQTYLEDVAQSQAHKGGKLFWADQRAEKEGKP
jgi:hypothetical protein